MGTTWSAQGLRGIGLRKGGYPLTPQWGGYGSLHTPQSVALESPLPTFPFHSGPNRQGGRGP